VKGPPTNTPPSGPAPREITEEHVECLTAADTGGYWWYEVRLAHVRDALSGLRGELRYLDFGCGTGGVLRVVMRDFAPRLALGIDGTQEAVEVAHGRGLPVRLADFRRPIELPFHPNAITCLDVLEHLEDPVAALRHLATVASHDALLVVTVPAMPLLHSRWDDLCGHHRRYTRRLLLEHLRAGGWAPSRMRHLFSYCVPPAFVQRRVLRRVPQVEFPPVSRPMNAALTWAGRVEKRLGCPLPFGTSLVALARRT
jgi:SAM-dependent methyltransferase